MSEKVIVELTGSVQDLRFRSSPGVPPGEGSQNNRLRSFCFPSHVVLLKTEVIQILHARYWKKYTKIGKSLRTWIHWKSARAARKQLKLPKIQRNFLTLFLLPHRI